MTSDRFDDTLRQPAQRPPKTLSDPAPNTRSDTTRLRDRILTAPRPLAFVLSGGGAYGAVQVGMLRALNEAGIEPDLIVGSSVGALNGVFVADDPATADARLTEIWSNIDAASVFGPAGVRRGAVQMMAHLVRHRTSLLSAATIDELIRTRTPRHTFGELTKPFAAVATDHASGEAVVLDKGELQPALAASSAIPGVLPARHIDGRRLVDGGVAAMFPTQIARECGAASIVLLDATPTDTRVEPPSGLPDGLIHTLAIMIRAQRTAAANGSAVGCPVFTVASATPPDATAFDFRRTVSLINDGYQRATGQLRA